MSDASLNSVLYILLTRSSRDTFATAISVARADVDAPSYIPDAYWDKRGEAPAARTVEEPSYIPDAYWDKRDDGL